MNQTGNTSTSIILYSNKSTVRQGEIENNPGYGKYIPNSTTMGNNAPSTSGLSPNYAHIFKNNSVGQNGLGLIENNPGYGKYIIDISNGKPFNYSNTGGNALSNATGSVGESLTNTSKTVGSSLEKGISSILNLGNNSGK